ncbi:29_t:CDS:2 [Acaulospora colombiana]|uniref:29_t:CDS:1 n=1 Tax=Acaulospora colombiana TaxID=27376 RepID=A0ACA9KS34_9GLOM|nr:29_t:CDS:2 [Acaulospora colombiana]
MIHRVIFGLGERTDERMAKDVRRNEETNCPNARLPLAIRSMEGTELRFRVEIHATRELLNQEHG